MANRSRLTTRAATNSASCAAAAKTRSERHAHRRIKAAAHSENRGSRGYTGNVTACNGVAAHGATPGTLGSVRGRCLLDELEGERMQIREIDVTLTICLEGRRDENWDRAHAPSEGDQ